MNEVTKTTSRADVRSLLENPSTIAKLQQVATKHMTADRLCRLVIAACHRTPMLLRCTPESVLLAAMTCSQYGVEPDGRHAHLIPYGQQCQLIIDYKGLIAIARRNGVEGIVTDIICAEDEFAYYRDETGTRFKHVPKFGQRGAIIGVYSLCRLDGVCDVEVMTCAEVEAVRQRSKSGNSGPWKTDWPEMAKKTVLRRHSKRWPLSGEMAELINSDEEQPAKRGTVTVTEPTFLQVPEVTGGESDEIPGAEVPPEKPQTEKAPVEAPAQAAKKQPAEKPEAPAFNPVKAITNLCKLEGITADVVLSWMRMEERIPSDCMTLDEAALLAPDQLKLVCEEWQAVLPLIKGGN